MSDKENLKIDVNPAPTLTLFFSILAMLFWAQCIGILKPESSLNIALIQIGLFPPYVIGATLLLKKGDNVTGNIFLMFAAFFGFAGGLASLGTYIASTFGWPIDTSTTGLFWLLIGVFLLLATPSFKTASALFFLIMPTSSASLIILGLTMMDLFPVALGYKLSGWILFYVGITGIYLATSGYYSTIGVNLPQGKPFFKERKSITTNL